MTATDATASRQEPLRAGWEALARTDWAEARSCFEAAVAEHESAEAFEGLGQAAWWLDDAATMFQSRERAFSLYRERDDHRAAARLAALVGMAYYEFRGDAAIGNGWFRRAHSLLTGLGPVPELGWLAVWEAQIALFVGEDPATARRLAAETVELGASLGITDLEMMGLGLEGLALVTLGEVDAGMAQLDEAAAAAVSGEMSDLIAIGSTCCCLVYACERVRDFDRAVQWCEKVQDFCRQAHWGSLFSICRSHHAAVLLWQGAWAEAEAELGAATRELQASRPGKVAEGVVRLAELRRRQGRLEEAERLLEPVRSSPPALLCFAALALDHGKPEDTLDLLQRFLRQVPDENRTLRAAAFELEVRAHAALGQIGGARAAVSEIEALADLMATDPMRASLAVARGLLAGAEAEYAESRRHLEDAVDLFDRAGAPYEAAHARLELAKTLSAIGREDLAVEEARAAHEALASMDARREARRAATLIRQLGADLGRRDGGASQLGLSPRELEVLRLVAQGLSNQRIAAELVLSEHTVRRHVANILRKLGVGSRAAAAVLAERHDLL